MSKQYQIPILYQKVAYQYVDADNLQEAVEKALRDFLDTPEDGYLDDSFEIDTVIEDNYPDEEWNEEKAINSLDVIKIDRESYE